MIRKLTVGELDKTSGPPRNMIFIAGQKFGSYEITEIVQVDPRHYQVYALHPVGAFTFLWKEYIDHPFAIEYETQQG